MSIYIYILTVKDVGLVEGYMSIYINLPLRM